MFPEKPLDLVLVKAGMLDNVCESERTWVFSVENYWGDIKSWKYRISLEMVKPSENPVYV